MSRQLEEQASDQVATYLAGLLLAPQPAHGCGMLLCLHQRLQERLISCRCLQLRHHLPAQRISLHTEGASEWRCCLQPHSARMLRGVLMPSVSEGAKALRLQCRTLSQPPLPCKFQKHSLDSNSAAVWCQQLDQALKALHLQEQLYLCQMS